MTSCIWKIINYFEIITDITRTAQTLFSIPLWFTLAARSHRPLDLRCLTCTVRYVESYRESSISAIKTLSILSIISSSMVFVERPALEVHWATESDAQCTHVVKSLTMSKRTVRPSARLSHVSGAVGIAVQHNVVYGIIVYMAKWWWWNTQHNTQLWSTMSGFDTRRSGGEQRTGDE